MPKTLFNRVGIILKNPTNMKKNLFALAALVAAITLSSFTTGTRATYFLTYKGSGDAYVAASYNVLSSATALTGSGKFNWIEIQDDNGILTDIQVDAAISAQDLNTVPSTHPLDNEVDRTGLDVKNP